MPRRAGEPGPTGADAQRNINRAKAKEAQTSGSRAEHQGRVAQPGVPGGPRNKYTTVAPSGETVTDYPGSRDDGSALHGSYRRRKIREYNRADKVIKQGEARLFEDHRGSDIARKFFEVGPKGIKTETIKVPKIKTDAQALKRDERRLTKILDSFDKAGVAPEKLERIKAEGDRIIIKKNVVTGPKGNPVLLKRKQPIIKAGFEAEYEDAVRNSLATVREIREGKKHYRPKLPENFGKAPEDNSGLLGSVTGVLGDLLNTAPGGIGLRPTEAIGIEGPDSIGDAVKPIKFLSRGATGNEVQQASLAPDLRGIRNETAKGIRTGLLVGGEYLTRPGMAIEAQIAKTLSDPLNPISGIFLDEKQRRKLSGGASSLDVLLHGHKAKNAITGKELSEALFGEPQLGLPIDLITDPTLWFGAGTLASRVGEKAAAAVARIDKVAPAAVRNAEVENLILKAEKSGDYDGLMARITEIAKDNDVSLKSLGRTKADKAKIREWKGAPGERTKRQLAELKEGREKAPKINGESIFVPTKQIMENVTEGGRYGLRSQIEPGFQINFQTPLGRRLGSVRVPLPKKIADARIIPRFGKRGSVSSEALEKARFAPAEEEINRKWAPEHIRLTEEIEAAKGNPTIPATEVKNLEKQLELIQAEIRTEKNAARKAIADEKSLGGRFSMSPAEAARKYNVNKRFAHEIYRLSAGAGRNVQRLHFTNVVKAVEPLKNDAKGRVKVGLHMAMLNDIGSDAMLLKYMPLNETEQEVFNNLRAVYDQMAESGLDAGVLESKINDYLPRMYSSEPDVMGSAKRTLDDELDQARRGRAAGADFTQHRNVYEVASLSDKTRMAELLRSVSDAPMSVGDSLSIAEKWYQMGKMKTTMEDMANALQRGVILTEDNMTKLQKAAYEWSRNMRSNERAVEPLFKDLERTEGVLKFDKGAFEEHSFVESPFEGLSAREADSLRQASAAEWRSRLEDLRDDAATPELADEYQLMIDQRQAELDSYRPGEPSGELPDAEAPTVVERPDDIDRLKTADAEETAKLKELQSQLGREGGYNVVLKNASGETVKTLPKTYQTAEDAYEAAGVLDEAGNLPPNTTVGIAKQPEVSAQVRKELAEQYSAQAQLVEEIQRERATLEAQIGKGKPERKPVANSAQGPEAKGTELTPVKALDEFVHNPSETYLGTLRDFRKTHPDKFPILDPLLSNFARTQREGLKVAFHARWKAIDETVGRSMNETRKGTFSIRGTDVKDAPISDLKPVWDDIDDGVPNAEADYFIHKPTGEQYDRDDLILADKTMIPYKDEGIWYDPKTGREYATASDKIFGGEKVVGPDRLWPTDVLRDSKQEFMRLGEGDASQIFDDALQTLTQKTFSLMRFGVTTYFPAYHVRNMVSDALISIMADPGVMFHPITNAKWLKASMARGGKGTITIPSIGEVEVADALLMFDTWNIRSNQHLAEFINIAETGRATRKTKFGLGPGGGVGSKAMEFSARREDIIRMQTFMQRMRRNGGDAADAMWYTIKHHFDYSDLSTVERRIFRNVFFFYTWFRKNIPLQFMSMISKPGFFSALTNTYIDVAEGATPLNYNWSKLVPILPDLSGPVAFPGLVPPYMITKLANPVVNWNGHTVALSLGYPWADMNLVTNFLENPLEATRQAGSLLNPAITIPAQLGLRTDLLTGRTYDQREASGSSYFLDLLGVSLPKDDEGNPTLPWWSNVLLGNVPFAGRGASYFRPTNPDEDPGRLSRFFGGGAGTFLTGASVYVSPKEGERLDLAYINLLSQWGGQRSALIQQDASDKELAEFDKQIKEKARELQVPDKYLHVIETLGPDLYITKEERKGFKLGDGKAGLFGGGSNAGLFGSGGGLNFESPKKKDQSSTEEALKKVAASGLTFGFGTTSLGEAGEASPEQTARALADLRANAATQKGERPSKPGDKPMRMPIKGAKHKAQAKHNEKVAKEPDTVDVAEAQELLEAQGANPKYAKQAAARMSKDDRETLGAAVDMGYGTKTDPKLKQLKNAYRKLKTKVDSNGLPKFSGFVDKDQEQFAQWLTKYSGLPAELVGPWVLAEGGGWGSEGVSGGGAGKQNWLGVGYPGETTELSEYSKLNEDPKTAAKFTADWLRGAGLPDGSWKAEGGIPEIIKLKDRSPEEIRDYIAGPSQWGTGHFELGTVQVTGTTGKPKPADAAKLKKVEAALTKRGVKPASLDNAGSFSWGEKKAKKLKGEWGGSHAVLRGAIKGFEVSSEKRAASDPLSVSNPGSDHNEANELAYAYDLPATGSAGTEIAQKVAKRLKIPNWEAGSYGPWQSPKYPGYDIQILWEVEGHYDHVHVGAHWTGNDLAPGTYAGSAYGSPSVSGGVPSSGSSGGSNGASGTAQSAFGPGYKPGRSKQARKEVQTMRENVLGAGGGSSNKKVTSLLTTNEAYNLGPGGLIAGDDIVKRLEAELDAARRRQPLKPAKLGKPRKV